MAVLDHVVGAVRIRRRAGGNAPRQKPGWQVPASLAEAVREVVAAGAAESQNAFVERALLRELAELRRERLFAAYAEAAGDPEFNSDMNAVSRSFDSAVADGLES